MTWLLIMYFWSGYIKAPDVHLHEKQIHVILKVMMKIYNTMNGEPRTPLHNKANFIKIFEMYCLLMLIRMS